MGHGCCSHSDHCCEEEWTEEELKEKKERLEKKIEWIDEKLKEMKENED